MQAPFHISCVGGGERERQPLPADRLRRGDAVPAAGAPVLVDAPPAGRRRRPRRRRAATPSRSPTRLSGASSSEAKRPASASTASTRSSVRSGNAPARNRLGEPGDVLQRERDVGNRRAIHGRSSPPSYTPMLDAPSPAGESAHVRHLVLTRAQFRRGDRRSRGDAARAASSWRCRRRRSTASPPTRRTARRWRASSPPRAGRASTR